MIIRPKAEATANLAEYPASQISEKHRQAFQSNQQAQSEPDSNAHSGDSLGNNPDFAPNSKSVQAPLIDPHCYQRAEKLACWYLKDLEKIASNNHYLTQLTADYTEWQSNNCKINSDISKNQFNLSAFEAEQQLSEQLDSWNFLEKLAAEKKLKAYLTKSITYIFMRDLGKSINDKSSAKKIAKTVSQIQSWIRKQSSRATAPTNQQLSTTWLFKKAQAYGVEDTFIWLMSKLSLVQKNMPTEIDQTNGMRKLVKIIAGVVLHQTIDLPENTSPARRAELLDQAIRLGYSYGLTYPFIDDLQDSCSALNEQEKALFNQAIRTSLLQGKVVTCPQFSQKNQAKMGFIYQELHQAFETIKSFRSTTQSQQFFEQAFIFFEAQDIDRQRKLEGNNYSTEELFLPIILKSSGCRLIAKDILNNQSDESFNHHTFCFGIYNQFNDDIKDIFEDLSEDNVTPYTYYLKRAKLKQAGFSNSQRINPYRIYWAVVYYLIYKVYGNNPKSKTLILERSINAHKSLKAAIGDQKYNQLTKGLLCSGTPSFDRLIDQLVKQPNDIAWFDKLISRHVAAHFEQKKTLQQQFEQRYQSIKQFVQRSLPIPSHQRIVSAKQRRNITQDLSLSDCANYSLTAGGKNLRAALAYVMCVDRYKNLKDNTIPILQLLEYMHTASIIFDDKPSQDNSDFRRGQPTLHKKYQSEATAELTGVFMMMRAVEVQSEMKGYPAQNVLDSLAYAASTTQSICEGQLMDLRSKSQALKLQQLELMSELKTGLAIEASLMIPAILNNENDIEKGHIKQFAKHLGLAFQIKDDLLDHLGSDSKLGKPTQQDSNLNKASFVTCLGEKQAQKKLYHHYLRANHYLEYMGEAQPFMAQVLEFVVHRDQ